MRTSLRSLRTRALRARTPRTIALTLVATLVLGIALVSAQPIASAQTAVPGSDLVVQAAPAALPVSSAVTAADYAAVRQAVAQARIRIQIAAYRKAQAVKVQRIRTRIVTIAKNQIGDRYSAGAAGPSAFDCSGLTRYVYKVATGKELPHQSHAQFARVTRVSRANARPGDLVFFFRGGAHHVGVYIGNGHMVDAAGYGEGVRISPISGSWWSRTYSGMGRLLPA